MCPFLKMVEGLSLGLLVLFFNSVPGIYVSGELRRDQSLTGRVAIDRTGWFPSSSEKTFFIAFLVSLELIM